MQATIIAVGKLAKGAERDLAERYLARAERIGANLGLKLSVREITDGRAQRGADRIAEEGAAIAAALPAGAVLCVLDERGQSVDSPALADRIAAWRDNGMSDLAFVIGGADGIDRSLRHRADLVLSFGAMTWPHQLVRAMLLEQLYRAITILAGHPYHRR